MITRIVKLTIIPEHGPAFKEIFYNSRKFIQAFDGCISVELMKNTNQNNVYFTLSCWRTEEDLNLYRESFLFKHTWSKVKPLFAEKAEASSLISAPE